ncbi:hypothetical protein CYMTET_35711 [Cymbomonas tetramitiformis]|uniref:Uncharacterized protein n=1 Tax=Cymbomonas tetramitiformis TaxID=36881 RepID=A0AAE0F8L6_9CHLO|nr:hypothetical protein CYMTET_35711 [Cymbomonas tetramitiformis]
MKFIIAAVAVWIANASLVAGYSTDFGDCDTVSPYSVAKYAWVTAFEVAYGATLYGETGEDFLKTRTNRALETLVPAQIAETVFNHPASISHQTDANKFNLTYTFDKNAEKVVSDIDRFALRELLYRYAIAPSQKTLRTMTLNISDAYAFLLDSFDPTNVCYVEMSAIPTIQVLTSHMRINTPEATITFSVFCSDAAATRDLSVGAKDGFQERALTDLEALRLSR